MVVYLKKFHWGKTKSLVGWKKDLKLADALINSSEIVKESKTQSSQMKSDLVILGLIESR